MASARAAALTEEFGAGRLLLGDARTAVLLVDHARHRAIARLLPIPREYENLLTLVVLVLLRMASAERVSG